VALVRERLLPVKSPDSKQVARWIADLSSDVFEQRQLAAANLERLGELAGRVSEVGQPFEEPGLSAAHALALAARGLARIRGVQVLEIIANPGTQGAAVLAGATAAVDERGTGIAGAAGAMTDPKWRWFEDCDSASEHSGRSSPFRPSRRTATVVECGRLLQPASWTEESGLRGDHFLERGSFQESSKYLV
jgi:hypothetical protein